MNILICIHYRLHAREDSRHNVCIAGLNEVQVSGPQGLIRVSYKFYKVSAQFISRFSLNFIGQFHLIP